MREYISLYINMLKNEKFIYIIIFLFFLFSCKQEADNGIKIDLTQKKTKIRYWNS